MTEGINETAVTAWMKDCIPSLEPPIEFSLIAGGRSNLTFRCVDRAGASFVLRRPPLGHVLESAHDMSREFRIISALQPTSVPVPKTYGLCQDKSVNEADFYVMSFEEGVVLHDSQQSQVLDERECQELGVDVIETLAKLHLVNPDEVGLGELARKEGYLARQLKRWTKQWEATKTHEIPDMEESCRLLEQKMPDQVGAAIVHGDFRLGNMIVDKARVVAILDWELCTLGDPLADLGYLLNSWRDDDALAGYPSRDELARRYSEKTRRDVSEVDYYRAFSYWRLAAISQGVYKRYLVGAMGEDNEVDLDRQKNAVHERAAMALALLQ